MAYFSNSSEDALSEQCSRCKFGQEHCPIAWVQITYNYEACNNKTAREILDYLVHQDGTCSVFEMAKKDFGIDPN